MFIADFDPLPEKKPEPDMHALNAQLSSLTGRIETAKKAFADANPDFQKPQENHDKHKNPDRMSSWSFFVGTSSELNKETGWRRSSGPTIAIL